MFFLLVSYVRAYLLKRNVLEAFLVSVLFFNVAMPAQPRATLTYFEQDLQKMSKTEKMPLMKEGSFVARLATKRKQKEIIEQELIVLNSETKKLQQEIQELENFHRECHEAIKLMQEKIEQQKTWAQQIAIEVENGRAELSTMAQ